MTRVGFPDDLVAVWENVLSEKTSPVNKINPKDNHLNIFGSMILILKLVMLKNSMFNAIL